MTANISQAVRSEQVGDKIVPVLTFPSGTWIHLMPHKIEDGQDPADVLRRWLDAWVNAPQKQDWRVGLSVKPKYRNHELFYEQGTVRTVFPSGYGLIVDKDGVLQIQMQSGRVLLAPSDEWVTA